jgi:hypothetical protein
MYLVAAHLGLRPFYFLLGQLCVGVKNEGVLLGFRELGLELRDLVLIGAAVELEQRLPFLHRHIFFDAHGREEGRLRKARNDLDGVLNDRPIRGIWRHEPQADDEHEEDVEDKERGDDSPAGTKLEPLELEEDKPEDDTEKHPNEDRCGHDVWLSLRHEVYSGGAALPASRASMASISFFSSRGKLRMSMTSVGLNAHMNAFSHGTTAKNPR